MQKAVEQNGKPLTANVDLAVKAIVIKLETEGLIRHVNGNGLDNRLVNLQRVTVLQALQNKDWMVDAVCHLTKAEFAVWEKLRRDFKVADTTNK